MTDQSPDLIAAVRDCLWRLYGYDAGPEGVHPVTADKYERDAIAVLGSIEAAGYVVLDAERWERLESAAAAYLEVWRDECGGDMECAWGNAGLTPGDLDPMPTGGECECEDCYPELTRAAGAPLPDGVTAIRWGWE